MATFREGQAAGLLPSGQALVAAAASPASHTPAQHGRASRASAVTPPPTLGLPSSARQPRGAARFLRTGAASTTSARYCAIVVSSAADDLRGR